MSPQKPSMHFNCHFIAFAIITCLAVLVRSESDEWGSFIFPPNASLTNYTLYAPTVAKIGNVHWNDDITIEYTLPDSVKTLWLSQECYVSLNDTNSTLIETGLVEGITWSTSGVYNVSTGKLAWNLGNGSGEGDYQNYCRFTLWDWTLKGCAWGPFGLLQWDQGGTAQDPLLYSEMFRILAPNSTEPALITNTAKTTLQSPAVTATQANVTCPPSGIPASAITTAPPQMDLIPPMADNVTFPAWAYPMNLDDEDDE